VAAHSVEFETCFNFRDLGGYPAADGRRVQPGRVFRSGSLQWLAPADLKRLHSLGVKTVVDLRSSAEVARGAAQIGSGGRIALRHAPLFEEDALPFTWAQADDPEPPPGQSYLAIAAVGTNGIACALRTIATDPHAVVVQCAAGRDRTGIVSALLLAALGIPDDEIAADYELSNHSFGPWMTWAKANVPDIAAEVAAFPPWLVQANPVVMAAFLDGLRERHGSIDGFLSGIGVDQAVITMLRDRLLD
jgi:protein-tyrosine phosphatase